MHTDPKSQSGDTIFTGNDLLLEEEKHNVMFGNLQLALGIPEEELAAMINEEHFNHQY